MSFESLIEATGQPEVWNKREWANAICIINLTGYQRCERSNRRIISSTPVKKATRKNFLYAYFWPRVGFFGQMGLDLVLGEAPNSCLLPWRRKHLPWFKVYLVLRMLPRLQSYNWTLILFAVSAPLPMWSPSSSLALSKRGGQYTGLCRLT